MNTLTIARRAIANHCVQVSACALGAILFAGCASGPPPALKSQLTGTDTSIAQAEQSGAAQGALPELQSAKDKRAKAQDAYGDKKWDLSMQLAQEAQVDAQYAASKSQANKAEKSADEVDRATDRLRDETERNLQKDRAEARPDAR